MNKASSITNIIYAILLIMGGVMGFLKAKSTISLIAGIFSGIGMLTAYKIGEDKPKEGYLYSSVISLLLAGFFSYRLYLTHSFMPAGIMFILSATTFVVNGLSYLKK